MIKLVVDCTCEMSVAEAAKMGITLLPMRMIIDEQEYLAGDNLDNDTFYNLMGKTKTFPKTMQINANDYKQVIQPLLDAGDDVFVMSVSSGLSGTFNSLTQAANEINSPHLAIFDSQTFTLAYYALVMEAHKMIEQGTTLDELTQTMEKLRERVRIYFIADTTKYLVKGGRISFVKGLMAEALHLKPIIGVVDKKLQMVAKGIGYNAAKRQIMRLTQNVDVTLPIYYGHIRADEKAENFKQLFAFDFAEKREIGPIVGAHGGIGCVGLAFFEKSDTPVAEKAEASAEEKSDTPVAEKSAEINAEKTDTTAADNVATTTNETTAPQDDGDIKNTLFSA